MGSTRVGWGGENKLFSSFISERAVDNVTVKNPSEG